MNIESLYNEIAPKLTNYLVASGMDYSSACDVVQETFIRIWKRRDELIDDASQISGLAYTIARNIRTDMARKAAKMTYQAEITDEDMKETAAPILPEEQKEENAKLREKLNAALKEVPPLLRDAFLMFQVGGLSIREIAQKTEVSESLVKVRIFRAKEKLREILKKENLL